MNLELKRGNLIYASLTQPPLEVIEDQDDLMEVIVRCPNCGQPTPFGLTRMISGYIGCDNDFKGGSCYFDDLMPRVMQAKRTGDPKYKFGPMYSIEEEKNG